MKQVIFGQKREASRSLLAPPASSPMPEECAIPRRPKTLDQLRREAGIQSQAQPAFQEGQGRGEALPAKEIDHRGSGDNFSEVAHQGHGAALRKADRIDSDESAPEGQREGKEGTGKQGKPGSYQVARVKKEKLRLCLLPFAKKGMEKFAPARRSMVASAIIEMYLAEVAPEVVAELAGQIGRLNNLLAQALHALAQSPGDAAALAKLEETINEAAAWTSRVSGGSR